MLELTAAHSAEAGNYYVMKTASSKIAVRLIWH